MTCLRAVDVTAQNFAQFGVVLTLPRRPPDLESAGELLYWDRLVSYGRTLTCANLGLLELKRTSPLQCAQLEVMPADRESYFCLDGAPAVLVVAPGSDSDPELSEARAFKLNGHSVVIEPGVWHYHPYPTERDSRYALLNSGDVLVRLDGSVQVNPLVVTEVTLAEPMPIEL